MSWNNLYTTQKQTWISVFVSIKDGREGLRFLGLKHLKALQAFRFIVVMMQLLMT